MKKLLVTRYQQFFKKKVYRFYYFYANVSVDVIEREVMF